MFVRQAPCARGRGRASWLPWISWRLKGGSFKSSKNDSLSHRVIEPWKKLFNWLPPRQDSIAQWLNHPIAQFFKKDTSSSSINSLINGSGDESIWLAGP